MLLLANSDLIISFVTNAVYFHCQSLMLYMVIGHCCRKAKARGKCDITNRHSQVMKQ